MTETQVYVLSPLTYQEFKEYYPPEFPGERLLLEQHEHRFDMFVDFLGWQSKHIFRDEEVGIECDAYDKMNSIYSIMVDSHYNYLGSTRAASTMLPYMLQEDEFQKTCFPGIALPEKREVFEGTRIISRNSKLYEGHRPIRPIKVATPLLLSHMELGQALGIDAYVGTMPPELLKKTYGRMGWEYHYIGPESYITDEAGEVQDKGQATQNYTCGVSDTLEAKIRNSTGIHHQINNYGVPDDVLPDLLAHMKENAHIEHPHRLETDLGVLIEDTKRVAFNYG